MLRRSLAAALCCVLLSVALAACGGGSSDNGVSSKSPNDIASAASTAVSKVNSVHVAGAVANGNSRFTINLSLVNGKGGTGSMSQGGLSFKIISVGNEVYINGSPTFWRQFGGASAAQLLSGKWLKAPASGQFASLAALTNIRQLFNQLLSTHGTLSKGQATTVRGQKVIGVTDKTNGGTLYVATTGKPYPIRIAKTGSNGGRVDFDQFNQPVTLTPPANAIDVSKLSSAGGQ
jgi:hypothetical protein